MILYWTELNMKTCLETQNFWCYIQICCLIKTDHKTSDLIQQQNIYTSKHATKKQFNIYPLNICQNGPKWNDKKDLHKENEASL